MNLPEIQYEVVEVGNFLVQLGRQLLCDLRSLADRKTLPSHEAYAPPDGCSEGGRDTILLPEESRTESYHHCGNDVAILTLRLNPLNEGRFELGVSACLQTTACALCSISY